MKALNPRLSHEYGKGWVLLLELDSDSVPFAKQAVDRFREGYVNIEVTRWSEKRSIQANAYFHVMCDRIAEQTNSTLDDVKVMMVQRYGTLARNKDGMIAGVVVPPTTNIADFYPYYKWYGTTDNGYEQYLFFKRTHELDKKEMSRLINGVVEEAKALNIETMPPRELERMMNQWQKKNATCAEE